MSGLDLYLSQRTLAMLLVYGALTGFGLGILYDGLRLLRMILGEPVCLRPTPPSVAAAETGKPKGISFLRAILLFVSDLVFALTATTALVLLCYYGNDGQIRAPAIVGLSGGFFVYRHTVSRPLVCLADRIIRLAQRGVTLLLRLLTMPLRALWALTARRWLERHRERATEKRMQELARQAACGFHLLEETGKSPSESE